MLYPNQTRTRIAAFFLAMCVTVAVHGTLLLGVDHLAQQTQIETMVHSGGGVHSCS